MKKYNKFQESIVIFFTKILTKTNQFILNVSGGKIGTTLFGGAPILELITVGRKSGLERSTPVVYLKKDNFYAIAGSRGGVSVNPGWFFNIQANPNVKVKVCNTTQDMTAVIATDEEKNSIWGELVEIFPGFDSCQQKTNRNIPVVFLKPVNS